jgi:hypothetical protein
MASTHRTEDELKAMMPNKSIPPIGSGTARPTWQSIKKCRALLAENAVAIPSRGQDPALGHAAIVIGADRYTDLSATDDVYTIPPEAVPPVYAVNLSYHQREELKRNYDQRVIDDYTHKAVETILTQMYLDAVHENYKTDFFTEELGYRCTFAELDDYMEIKFNKKTSKELADNELIMKQPWNATVPIEALFRRIDACQRFDPSIPEATIVRNTVDIVCINDGFEDAFKGWNAKRQNEKTWLDFKEHFGDADQARSNIMALKNTLVTTPGTYPGSANSAAATTLPTASTDPLVPLFEQLLVALAANNSNGIAANATAAAVPGPRQEPRPHVPRATNPAGGRTPTPEEAGNMSYCWSHGFCQCSRRADHTSMSCTRHRIGHQSDATAANMMGGETRVCNSWPTTNRRAQRE